MGFQKLFFVQILSPWVISNFEMNSSKQMQHLKQPKYGPRPLIKMNLIAYPGLGGGTKIIFCPNFINFVHFQQVLKGKTAKHCNI